MVIDGSTFHCNLSFSIVAKNSGVRINYNEQRSIDGSRSSKIDQQWNKGNNDGTINNKETRMEQFYMVYADSFSQTTRTERAITLLKTQDPEVRKLAHTAAIVR